MRALRASVARVPSIVTAGSWSRLLPIRRPQARNPYRVRSARGPVNVGLQGERSAAPGNVPRPVASSADFVRPSGMAAPCLFRSFGRRTRTTAYGRWLTCAIACYRPIFSIAPRVEGSPKLRSERVFTQPRPKAAALNVTADDPLWIFGPCRSERSQASTRLAAFCMSASSTHLATARGGLKIPARNRAVH